MSNDPNFVSSDSLHRSPQADATATNGPFLTLAAGAVIGPILFLCSWVFLGLLSPGYSPVSQPISALGVGPNAALMNTAFVTSGLLLMVGVFGIFRDIRPLSSRERWSCTAWLGLSGLGGIVCGLFPMTLVVPHLVGVQLAFTSTLVSFPIAGRCLRRVPHWRGFGTRLLFGGSFLTGVLLGLFMMTFRPDTAAAGVGVGGLTQRILLVEIHGWFVALGWATMSRAQSETPRSRER